MEYVSSQYVMQNGSYSKYLLKSNAKEKDKKQTQEKLPLTGSIKSCGPWNMYNREELKL